MFRQLRQLYRRLRRPAGEFPLEWATTEDLLRELGNRHDTIIFCGINARGHANTLLKGPWITLLGLSTNVMLGIRHEIAGHEITGPGGPL